MNILIEIETRDERLASQLLEAPKKFNRKADLPGNAVLKKLPTDKLSEGILLFVLTFANRVDTGLMANWLYEKLKDRATRLCLDRIEVQINKSEIERVILEKAKKGTRLTPI